MSKTTYTLKEWHTEGRNLFGDDQFKWKFVCPVCKYVATYQDWFDLKGDSSAAFSCIGRLLPKDKMQEGIMNPNKKKDVPCNYAGGGLFKLNPLIVTDDNGKEHQMFDFFRGEQ